jgi:hypothetical protein
LLPESKRQRTGDIGEDMARHPKLVFVLGCVALGFLTLASWAFADAEYGFRYEQPGKMRKITVNDLPQPYLTPSAENGADIVPRPADAWPKAPAGFKVEQYATD